MLGSSPWEPSLHASRKPPTTWKVMCRCRDLTRPLWSLSSLTATHKLRNVQATPPQAFKAPRMWSVEQNKLFPLGPPKVQVVNKINVCHGFKPLCLGAICYPTINNRTTHIHISMFTWLKNRSSKHGPLCQSDVKAFYKGPFSKYLWRILFSGSTPLPSFLGEGHLNIPKITRQSKPRVPASL